MPKPPCALPHKVTIQTPTETPNEFGDLVQTWAAAVQGTRRCCIKPLTGKELERAQAVEATASHDVWLRYAVGVNPKMRLAHTKDGTTRYLNIVSRAEFDRTATRDGKHWLYLLCAEDVS